MPFAGVPATSATIALLVESAIESGRHPFRYLNDPRLFLTTRLAVVCLGAS